MRNAAFVIGVLTLAAGPAPAQEARPWAERLFDYKTERDFGNVPHGAQLAHKFSFKNIYEVPLDVTVTRVSCGCLTATPSKKTVQKNETADIEVTINTRHFTGARTVRIHVQFSHPKYYSTAELKVTANSRPDIVFNPGLVHFGVVAQGQGARQAIDVEYAGALDWRVHKVVGNGLPVEVGLEKLYQRPGQVGYRVTVALKPEAPAGPLKGEIFLETNDPASRLVPVLVEATVQPALSVAPPSLRPALKVGQEKEVNVVVRGNKDFRVLAVEGLGDGITLTTPLPDAPSATHRLTLLLRQDQAGDLRRKLRIKTDLQAAPVTVSVDGSVSP